MVRNPFGYGVKNLTNLEVVFDRNLAPTWAPIRGSKKRPRLDFLELNIDQNPPWGHLGPRGPPGHQNYRFLTDFSLIFYWFLINCSLVFWSVLAKLTLWESHDIGIFSLCSLVPCPRPSGGVAVGLWRTVVKITAMMIWQTNAKGIAHHNFAEPALHSTVMRS